MAAPINPQPQRTPNSLFDLAISKTISNLWRPSIFQRVFSSSPENPITPTARAAIISTLTAPVRAVPWSDLKKDLAWATFKGIPASMFCTYHPITDSEKWKNKQIVMFPLFSLVMLSNLMTPLIKLSNDIRLDIYPQIFTSFSCAVFGSLTAALGLIANKTTTSIYVKSILTSLIICTNIGLMNFASRFINRTNSYKKTALLLGANIASTALTSFLALKILKSF